MGAGVVLGAGVGAGVAGAGVSAGAGAGVAGAGGLSGAGGAGWAFATTAMAAMANAVKRSAIEVSVLIVWMDKAVATKRLKEPA